ncbi:MULTISPECIES: AAA family ATPase [Actinosynnema]|uniref:AAA family ATPase n=1 Tax=Actinosynnema TaxID=40566 RepID=UPI0020A5554B|nr:AAA family ATPase [Actinosynnema pretiosum]MCP2094693.1 AAA domain (dynein-related subfamily) [Actinosynnema pretiosum]
MSAPIPPDPTTATAPDGDDDGTAHRLGSGALRAMVARVLFDQDRTPLSAGQIATRTGRSSGAIGNALKKLAEQGAAEVVSISPLTYRSTGSTLAAATPPVRSRPGRSGGRGRPSHLVTGPVSRPNGTAYHPRTLAGLPDVTVLRRLRDAGVPALLYGPPGTGKTSMVEAAFPDCLTVQGDGDTVVADLVGDYTRTPAGEFVFVHGPLVRAMREGVPLFVDDATLIPPTVLAVVYPAMDGRRQIVIKANGGEVVDAAPGFYVVAGHNPGVHGAVLSDALASRFSLQVRVSTDYALATGLGVDDKAVRVARNLFHRQGRGEVGWAPQLRELLAFQKIAAVLGIEAAVANLVGVAPEEDRAVVAAVARDAFGQEIEPLALGARITPARP